MSIRLTLSALATVCYLAATAGVAHADGCPPSTCGTSSAQVPGSGLLFVRPSGQFGPLEAYDAATGARRFQLARGTLAADGTHYVTVRRNVVRIWTLSPRLHLLRRWQAPRESWLAAVSADARRVVLQERARGNHTPFVVVDTVHGRLLHRIDLRGSYQAEALSPDSRRLFLIRWVRLTYDLRTLDFATRALRPTRLAEPDEKMKGTAATAIETRDGHWLLTLYVGGGENGTFVHALDLRSGVAHCIDLPTFAPDATIGQTAALALSPSGKRLYLANPLLGRVTVVDVPHTRVVRNVGFRHLDPMHFGFGIGPDAAVSPRGRLLAFAAAGNVWLYDTASAKVRGPLATGRRLLGVAPTVRGLGFTSGGGRVTALLAGGNHASFDAAGARRLDRKRPAELVVVRNGVTGPLSGYDADGGLRFVLPDGRASADGTSYFAALPRDRNKTLLEHYDPKEGRRVDARILHGRWRVGAVSASGTAVALVQHARGSVRVRIVAPFGRVLAERTLRGAYTLDAVSDNGRRLFLIQHYRSGRYAVRALSLTTGRIRTATLREKGTKERPLMTGRAAAQVASRDGHWLLTLYLDTKDHKAFVHALDLRRAAAVCIDLPGAGRPQRALAAYSLSLAPDGDVYASNAMLGVVARVDLRQQSVSDAIHFAPAVRPAAWASSALSPSGRTLSFASGRSVWRFDTASDALRGPTQTRQPVLGLAFSRDGRKLFAAQADGGVATLVA